MKHSAVALLLLISVAYATDSPATDGEKQEKPARDLIIELTQENFDKAILEHKLLVIFFYTSDCDRCKEELYEYLNAAKAVREASSKTRFAVVHGTKQKELVEKLGIHRFPTIRLVVNGNFANAYEYKYVGQKHISVLNWLSKLAMPVRRVDDAEELKKATHGHNVPVGFFRDANSREAILYQLVARDDADTNYCMVTNTTLIDELKIEGNARILFYRPDGSSDAYDGPWESKAIRIFVDALSLPIVVPLNVENSQIIGRNALKRQAILFASQKPAQLLVDSFNVFRKLAEHYRGKLLFVFDDLNVNVDNDRLRGYFGIQPGDSPRVRILFSEDKYEKYRPTSETMEEEALKKFIDDVLNKRAETFTLSQSEPSDWDAAPLKRLVASTLRQVALDRSRSVLVFFTSPWCSSCEALETLLRDLADQLADRDDVRIGLIDTTKNEIEGLHLRHSFPALRLFPKDSDESIEYSGDRSVEALKKFVLSDGKEIVRTKRRARDEL